VPRSAVRGLAQLRDLAGGSAPTPASVSTPSDIVMEDVTGAHWSGRPRRTTEDCIGQIHAVVAGHGGGHLTWTCWECDQTVHGLPLGPHCSVVTGPASVRISTGPAPEQPFEPPPPVM
jgi:hypothetical protein